MGFYRDMEQETIRRLGNMGFNFTPYLPSEEEEEDNDSDDEDD